MRAYESDELDLTESERASVRNLASTPGSEQPTASVLIAKLRKDGRDQAVLECALGLPLEEYYRVEEVYREVDPPRGPSRRRAR